MKIYDISIAVKDDMIVWPKDPKISITSKMSIENGDICNVKSININTHAGTHIDAPNHFIKDGKYTDDIPLDFLIGECLIVDLEHISGLIKYEHLKKHDFKKHKRVLFKTKNSKDLLKKGFNKNFVALSLEASRFLCQQGILLVGIDYLSIEAFDGDGSVHKQLLKNNIIVLESINLNNIKAGNYELICLPLKLFKCDGAPSRVILRELECHEKL